MSDYDNAIFRLATAQEAEPEDYTGEDGLLYCGSCRQPKEAYFTEGKSLFGRDRHPKECDCQRKRREKQEAADREQKHREEVARLKRKGFTNPAMLEWTFENDNGKCPQMDKDLFYAAHWEEMKAENIGYLLWGKVGTGKGKFPSLAIFLDFCRLRHADVTALFLYDCLHPLLRFLRQKGNVNAL